MCIHTYLNKVVSLRVIMLLPKAINYLSKFPSSVVVKGSPRQPQNNVLYWCGPWVPPRVWLIQSLLLMTHFISNIEVIRIYLELTWKLPP